MRKDKSVYSTPHCLGYMVKTAWKHQRDVLWRLMLAVACAVGLQAMQLYAAPEILASVERQDSISDLLRVILMFSLGMLLVSTVKTYFAYSAQLRRIAVRSVLIDRVIEKACTMSYCLCSDSKAIAVKNGAYMAVGDNNSGTEHIWVTLETLLSGVGCFAVYLTLLTDLNPVLAVAVIAMALVGYLVTRRLTRWQQDHREELNRCYVRENYVANKAESDKLAKDVRLFGLRDWLMELYEKSIRLHKDFVYRRERVLVWGDLLDVLLTLLRNGLAYWYLISMAIEGQLTTAQFLLYFAAASGFADWVGQILNNMVEVQKECREISSVLEWIEYPEPFRFTGGKPIPKGDGYELRLENVSFRYPEAEKPVFEHLYLTIHPGEKLAVVGLNGAGKTTLVKLICGLLDPVEGRVLLNGVNIRELNRREYYACISGVFQDNSLLPGSVAENITLSETVTDTEKVNDCIEKAGLTEFVSALPKGLNTHYGKELYPDGVEFSGGQTQRLLLARALYKDGPILVLDEPTAALDPLAESDIYQKYNAMTKGKTSVFISHRLASTRFCDRILYLKDGVIAEEGTHEELLAKNGGYAQLFEIQSRYYQEGRDFRD